MAEEHKTRILVVEDHAVVRKGLIMVLRLEPDFEIVGEAENGQIAVEMAQRLQPDLVLLDYVMPEMDGGDTSIALRKLLPDIKILMLSGVELDDRALDLLSTGVDGYIIKDIEPEELNQAIRTVAQGEAYLHPSLARRLLNQMTSQRQATHDQATHLTPREKEVLTWMATPKTYREIAEELVVTEETIRSHAKKILSKLHQPNRAQAVLAAVRAGLLELPE